ncbi:MAG: TIGR00730 family Rossman fold protein [Anaerolineales bacterium]|nr:TIGR00730 family Rossman fold protein [Anaerolineales bacterium]
MWYNFGGVDSFANSRAIARRAFDLGVTHFDLANNYGPPPGSAEETFGQLLKKDFAPYRDELIISTKAGWDMWPGPYGEFGSRKYLLASLDQSLKRMGLDYVDIFYSHRPDPETPFEETMGALADGALEKSGQVIGVIVASMNTPALAHPGLTRMEVTPLIHQRKARMYELAEGFIALPGGYGTLDELFETLTWAQIGVHAKPVGLLNVNGYFDPLLAMLDRAEAEGFIFPEHRRSLICKTEPEKLLTAYGRTQTLARGSEKVDAAKPLKQSRLTSSGEFKKTKPKGVSMEFSRSRT